MVKITRNIVDKSKYSIKCPYSMVPQHIIIHNTANDASAANEIAYMRSNGKQVSFHYAVDDKEIVQGVEENRNTWNAGDGSGAGNRKGIAIEICYSKSGGERFLEAERNAAEFTASLLKKYGWGLDHVKKHQDFNGKGCPHRTLELGWDRFLKMVEGFLNASDVVPGDPGRLPQSYTAVVIAKNGLNVRKGPGTKYHKVKVLPLNSKITILEELEGWGRVDTNYWVSLEWVNRIENPVEKTNAKAECRVLQTGIPQITNKYGLGHGGVDIVKKTKQVDAITAHSDGIVVWCQSGIPNAKGSTGNRSYGNAVKIKHGNGFYTLYAHMAVIDVKKGDSVKLGQKIGFMGNTGNSYGAHLHFEVRNDRDVRVDPTKYLTEDLPNLETNLEKPASAKYTTGQYEVTTNVLTVRNGPATSYSWKSFRELSQNARDQIIKLAGYRPNGYVKGMLCDVSKVQGEWGKTPSGWICLKYCKKKN